ncbi:MAG: helix-turn-helix domain-containing protein [Gammaproteobacteria bacterium]|nr:helix-turn-helix domain-containing protein [Gammaproteobacteria bacterium]
MSSGQSHVAQYLTVDDVATLMKVSVKTVYCWCATGYLPCVKFGHLVRIDRDEFRSRLDEIKRQSRRKGS